jgi:predicted amino acid-binding ACT domain protein
MDFNPSFWSRDDLKKEVQELKNAFNSKGKKKEKEIELSKDDYFEWG